MGCWARPAVFFLLVLPALASAYVPPTWFSYYSPYSTVGCFPQDEPKLFWGQRSYINQNPFIGKFFLFDFYSYSFDGADGSSNWNLSLMNGTAFLSKFPANERAGFLGMSEKLDRAGQTLSTSSNSAGAAHNVSVLAQYLGAAPFFLTTTSIHSAGWAYVFGYPPGFWGALSGSAQMFSGANEIGRLAAAKVDERREKLEYAGAAASYYHGNAKGAYVSAANLASNAGFCGRQQKGAKAVIDYFNSSPELPQTMPREVSSYLSFTLGSNNSSSIATLASAYNSLGRALALMEREGAESKASAAEQLSILNARMAEAKAQAFDLMVDLPPLENSTSLSTGTLHSSLPSVVAIAEADASSAGKLAAGADSLLAGKPRNYLADAISNYDSAYEKASSAAASIKLALSEAAKYEARERGLAQSEISKAQGMLSNLPSGTILESKVAAEKQLAAAEDLFNSAAQESAIGRRYGLYRKSLAAAQGAIALLQGGTSLPLSVDARRQLDEIEKFLLAAKTDGVDVDFYLDRLAEYRRFLGASGNPETILAIGNEAAQNRRAVELLLQSKYSGLGEKYSQLAETMAAIREVDPSFLPAFDALRAKLANGRPDILPNAGHLKEIGSGIDSLNSQLQPAIPAKLSLLLAKNAVATSLHEPLALGKPSNYRIRIMTRNPSGLGYAGAVPFKVAAEIPLYSSDNHSGDAIIDASPEGKSPAAAGQANWQMNEITVPSVAARQEFNIVFEKQDSPAQQTSLSRSCAEATQERAEETVAIDFSAARALDALLVSSSAPMGADSAALAYNGMRYPAELHSSGTGLEAEGAIRNVADGENSLAFQLSAANPFSLAIINRTLQNIGNGKTRVDYVTEVSSQSLDCRKASIILSEPYSGVEDYSVSAISGEFATPREPIAIGAGSLLGFSFSPLRMGGPQLFAVSFTIKNASQALSEALQNAELAAQMFNRTNDLDAIADAKRLAALNRTDAALSAVLAIQDSQKTISTADYKLFVSENSSAGGLLGSALAAQNNLAGQNFAAPAAQLASLTSQLQSEISKAGSLAEAGKYKSAADALRSASSAFRASLSSLAWKASSQAADDYAKAKKSAQGAHADELSEIEGAVSLSQRQFSSGSQLDSFASSSLAQSRLSMLQTLFAQDSEQTKAAIWRISSDFSSLQKKAEEALSAYSSQYASLTTQSKRKLPITPADAQKALQDAIKGMEKAAGAKDPAGETLLAANGSYASLADLVGKLGAASSSLKSSARSSLGLAKAGLSEAKQKASPSDSGDISAIEKEVDKADGLFADSLYSDSLASSDRALSAASLFVQKKAGQGALEPKTMALGAVSVLFIAAAAYYFWQSRASGKSKGKRDERREVPKAE